MTIREQFNRFVDSHEVAWILTMAVMAIAYVAVGFAIDTAEPGIQSQLQAAETG